MPEWDSAYGASSKASFDAGKAPKGTYGGGNGQKSSGNGTKTTGGNGVKKAATAVAFIKKPLTTTAKWIGQRLFKPKEPTLTEKTAAMEDAPFHQQKKMYDWGPQNDGGGNVTTVTQSLVTAPTADKAAGFGHQWNFQAYGNQAQATANPYDYTKAPYAKKGKLIRKYATGQEIKNFSKGKRFGPPPLKGPDSQGLQVILENSDYFKKLIG